MPFDGTQVETPAMRRAILVDALRNDKTWNWNFCHSAGCAIGMTEKMWFNSTKSADSRRLSVFFGMSLLEVHQIFGATEADSQLKYGISRRYVTPAMVADALEKIGQE